MSYFPLCDRRLIWAPTSPNLRFTSVLGLCQYSSISKRRNLGNWGKCRPNLQVSTQTPESDSPSLLFLFGSSRNLFLSNSMVMFKSWHRVRLAGQGGWSHVSLSAVKVCAREEQLIRERCFVMYPDRSVALPCVTQRRRYSNVPPV